MSSGWYGTAFDGIRARSLFVKVMPAPASLSERRAVLHALQRYGAVDVFKRLTKPDTFICATSKVSSAEDLVKVSPLRFRFISESLESIQAKAAPGSKHVSVAAPIHIHEHRDGIDRDRQFPPRPTSTQPDPIKMFKVHINPSNDYYDHRTTIRRNPLHGPWPPTLGEDRDSVYFALKNVVPDNIANKALCDWRTGGQLSEDAKITRASGGFIAKELHVQERQLRKKTQLLLERVAENDLVAWKSVDTEAWRRDQKVADARRAVSEGPVPATIPQGVHQSNAQEPAPSSRKGTLDAVTAADQPAPDLLEWQKLVKSAGMGHQAPRPAPNGKRNNVTPRTVPVLKVPGTRDGGVATARQLRRSKFMADQRKRLKQHAPK